MRPETAVSSVTNICEAVSQASRQEVAGVQAAGLGENATIMMTTEAVATAEAASPMSILKMTTALGRAADGTAKTRAEMVEKFGVQAVAA